MKFVLLMALTTLGCFVQAAEVKSYRLNKDLSIITIEKNLDLGQDIPFNPLRKKMSIAALDEREGLPKDKRYTIDLHEYQNENNSTYYAITITDPLTGNEWYSVTFQDSETGSIMDSSGNSCECDADTVQVKKDDGNLKLVLRTYGDHSEADRGIHRFNAMVTSYGQKKKTIIFDGEEEDRIVPRYPSTIGDIISKYYGGINILTKKSEGDLVFEPLPQSTFGLPVEFSNDPAPPSNVRADAGTGNPVVGKVAKNGKAKIIDPIGKKVKRRIWYKIEFTDKNSGETRQGWASGKLFRIYELVPYQYIQN